MKQFKVPVCAERWFCRNETECSHGVYSLCAHTRYLNIPSVVDGDDWCQASGKAGEFSRERVQGRGVLLTGVPLCLSLPGGDRTVLVGEQNLLQLTHLRPQRRHLVLEKTNTVSVLLRGVECVSVSVYLSERVSPVAAGSCASAPRLSSPAMTPRVSFSAGSVWLQPGYVQETSACARRGRALSSSCVGCLLLLPS